MNVVILGAGGYFPNRFRHTTCLLLPELGVVLDAGTGMYRLRQWRQTDQLDIFLSHAHLDHVVGLTYLLGLYPDEPAQHRRVYANAATRVAVEDHLFYPDLFPVRTPLQFLPLERRTRLASGANVVSFPLEHPGGSMGFRIEHGGRTLAYVTDTTADSEAPYVSELQGVDVLVHECNFADGAESLAVKTGHSILSRVLEVALRAQVGRLVLIHMDPTLDAEVPFSLHEARALFPNVQMGHDEMVLSC